MDVLLLCKYDFVPFVIKISPLALILNYNKHRKHLVCLLYLDAGGKTGNKRKNRRL